MVRHLHISKLDQIQASSDVWAGSLITRDAIFFNDVCLRHHGELRAYKLRKNHLPTFLEGGSLEVIESGKCIDYLELAQQHDVAWTIHELFPEHYWGLDFEEVPIAHDTWQPKIDLLQAQIDDLDSTYATDAQVVASFADQIAAAGDVFNLVDTKVGEEKTRAEAAELTLTQAVVTEKNRAEAAELAIEAFFEGTDASALADRDQIKLDFAAGDATNAAAVVTEKNRAEAAEVTNAAAVVTEKDRAEAAEVVLTGAVSAEASTARAAEVANAAAVVTEKDRAEAAEVVLTSAVSAEASTARAAEVVNAAAVVTQKDRIDAILNLSTLELDTFKEIEDAYKAADGSVETTVTNLVNARVTIATYTVDQDAQDVLILQNTGKTTYSDAVLVASHTVDITTNAAATVTEKARAEAAEVVLTNAVTAEASTARANEQAIEDFFEGTNLTMDADRAQIKLDFASGDATNAAAVVTEKARAEAAEVVLTSAVSAEASTARAAEGTNLASVTAEASTARAAEGVNAAAVVTEKARAEAAEVVLTSAVSAEASTARAAEVANAAALVTEKDRAEAAEVVLTSAVSAEAVTARAAESANASALLLKQNSLTVSEQAVVAAHAYDTTEKDKVAANVLKTSYTDSVLVASHVVDIAANAAAITGKQPTIANDHLNIAHTSGLQNALDAHPALDTSVLFHSTANGGRIGVGTAAPSKTLHVHATASGDLARFSSDGAFNIQYMSDNKNFQFTHTGDDVVFYQKSVEVARFTEDGLRATQGLIVPAAAPASSSSSGVAGEIRFDSGWIYICHTTDTWKRVQLSATGW